MRFGGLFSGPKKRYTVAQALDDYEVEFTLRGCRSGTSLRSEIGVVKRRLGAIPVSELSVTTLRRLQTDLVENGYAAASVNKYLAILSAALRLAAENDVIPSVPRFPRRLRPAAPRQGFLEHDDYLAIREALPDWGRPVLDFGYYSGWRKSEILGLLPEEVDLEARQVRLRAERSKNREARVLPLAGFGLEALKLCLKVPARTVFHRYGSPISSTVWHGVWTSATRSAGCPGRLFHDLRRTVVRRLELSGVPRKVAMAWVGHRTESIYLRYSITSERDLAPAAERMLRFLRPQAADGNIVPFLPKKRD